MKKPSYSKIVTEVPSATTKLPGQIENSTGGFGYQVDKWGILNRFLVLGSDAPTYYASSKELTFKNYGNVLTCIEADGKRVVDLLVDMSKAGRVPKKDTLLFALALCLSSDNLATKQYAATKVNDIAEIGTNIMMLFTFLDDLRGRGNIVKRLIQRWFENREVGNLVNQVIKYRQRDGVTMRDLLRISKPIPKDEVHKDIYHWVTKGWENVGDKPHPDQDLVRIWAFERAKITKDPKEIAKLVKEYRLPWEAVNSEFLKSEVVWDALLEHIKPEALIRSLGKLSANGFTGPMSDKAKLICGKITNKDSLIKSRVHPIKILYALKTYEQGHGIKGDLTWKVNADIVEALNDAFDLSFGNIQPINKKVMLCLDVSGSMGSQIAGSVLTSRDASAALTMLHYRVEKEAFCVGFSRTTKPIEITRKDSFSTVLEKVDDHNFGTTNPASAIEYALENKIPAEAFVIITDNEVNTGNQPAGALQKYRKKTGINAKMVVMATTPTDFTIADPKDGGMLDVVGFDTAAPNIISDFIAGKI